ncbi:MAG: hypothetical protein LPK08_09720, partial [Halomonas sp.]|nr:hypothetical protein [Halomonas sp.]MDX5503129.1 hypothetical protein [Halomonas sp.]
MGQHVTERDRAIGRLGDHVVAFARDPDAVVAPGRDEAADRVVQLKVAALIQHHKRHRGDRLGHGIDAEDGVVPHDLVPLQVHGAEGLLVGDVAVPGDLHLTAGDLLRADVVAFQMVADALK